MNEQLNLERRRFLAQSASGLGVAALSTLFAQDGFAANGRPELPHFTPRAKRVIYLFQSGGPSQMDLFDDKPAMKEYFDKDLPDSVRMGQRITTMTSGQKRFPIAPSIFQFQQHGESG
ncbi:MAG: DUF1501 domain-containing protein, partial [Planctomycetaceae bacterium]|nr:DUF1501 domain-containing protein [Planctomycetaceae bacterium]